MSPILTNFVGVSLICLLSFIWANEICNPDVYRCPGNQTPIKYNKKSDCTQNDKIRCEHAKSSCVCINVEKVCKVAGKYAGGNADTVGAPLIVDVVQAETTTGTTGAKSKSNPSTIASTPSILAVETPAKASAVRPGFIEIAGVNSQVCKLPLESDGSSCHAHKDCNPVTSGISLCCDHKCLHVHNVPCVRNFFKKEDQLCTDVEYQQLFIEGHLDD